MLWKRLIDSIKDLVDAANFECSPGGISIQAIDTSHVALVALLLKADGFAMYNCSRSNVLGINLQNLSKILKTTESTDSITLRHEDDSDIITLVCDSVDNSKVSEYQLKLMEIEAENMGIPDLEYKTFLSLPSADFQKICRDMTIFGDTVTIQVSKEGVKFSASGDVGEGFCFLKASSRADERRPNFKSDVKPEVKNEKGDVKHEKGSDVKHEKPVKKEKAEEDDDDITIAEKFAKNKNAKEIKQVPSDSVHISIEEPVSLSFALRYLNTFCKAASISERVDLHLAKDSPCMIEFKLEGLGFLRYYLAPKVDEAGAE